MPAGMRICRMGYVKNYKSIVSHLTEKGKYLQEKLEYFKAFLHNCKIAEMKCVCPINLSLIYGKSYSIFSNRCIRRNKPCRLLQR